MMTMAIIIFIWKKSTRKTFLRFCRVFRALLAKIFIDSHHLSADDEASNDLKLSIKLFHHVFTFCSH